MNGMSLRADNPRHEMTPMSTPKKKMYWRGRLEWLCDPESYPQYWKADGTLNIYALRRDIVNAFPKRTTSQSTLARLYSGDSEEIKEETLDTLSMFFQVPKALIREDVEWDTTEMWGMDVTVTELRLLAAMRELNKEQRRVVRDLIRSMLPGDKQQLIPEPTPRLTPDPPARPNKH